MFRTDRRLGASPLSHPRYDLFDAIVAENGGLPLRPALHEERVLGLAPPAGFIAALRRRRIAPLSVGRSIVATWQPNETLVLEAIRECGLEWQIVFNKGAVMCLPPRADRSLYRRSGGTRYTAPSEAQPQ